MLVGHACFGSGAREGGEGPGRAAGGDTFPIRFHVGPNNWRNHFSSPHPLPAKSMKSKDVETPNECLLKPNETPNPMWGSGQKTSKESEAYCKNCCYVLLVNTEGYCDVCATGEEEDGAEAVAMTAAQSAEFVQRQHHCHACINIATTSTTAIPEPGDL